MNGRRRPQRVRAPSLSVPIRIVVTSATTAVIETIHEMGRGRA